MRGGFCRPPRQLYPQEERGIQRPNNSTYPHSSPSQKWAIRPYFLPIPYGLTRSSKRGNTSHHRATADPRLVVQADLFAKVQTHKWLSARLCRTTSRVAEESCVLPD